MVLDLRQNFVSPQYLENQSVEFHQILYLHSSWQDVAWDCYITFFAILYKSHGPLFRPKFHFRSNTCKQIDRISPNFIYAFNFARSSLGLLHIISCTFIPELWPLICTGISFPLNILRNNWYIFTKFHTHSYLQDLVWDCYMSFFSNLYHI